MRIKILLLVLVLALSWPSFAQTVTPLFPLPGLIQTGALAQGSDGGFYGISGSGCGAIFRITLSGAFTFNPFGCSPSNLGFGHSDDSALGTAIEAAYGNFYGTTLNIGDHDDGTVFKFIPSVSVSTLYSFIGGNDGANVGSEGQVGVTQGSDGALYGITNAGGDANQDGAIFKITPPGAYTQLHVIHGGTGGLGVAGPLLQASDGNFYGATILGGGCSKSFLSFACGTIFRVTPAGDFTTIYSFSGDADGAFLNSGLVEGPDGALYGTTREGGNLNLYGEGAGGGTIFRITLAGALTTLYTFQNGADGSFPTGSLFLAGDGNLYGTTKAGSIFRVTPAGQFTTLLAAGIGSPGGGLVQGDDGNLYGTTVGVTISNPDSLLYRLSTSPALAPPVQLTLSQSTVPLNTPVTLHWQVLNAFSTTMQQCDAFVQNNPTGAGAWTGLQTGTLENGVYSGSATITPTDNGIYTYALTCGGIESAFATLTAGTPPPLSIAGTSLPTGTVGVTYTASLAAKVGVGQYTWSLASGALPQGLALAPSGQIAGTPTQAGTANFVVAVHDSATPANTQFASLSISIAAGAPTVVAQVTPSSIASGQTASLAAAVTGVASGPAPAGIVQFSINGTNAGAPVPVSTGQATLPNQLFSTSGTYAIRAAYSGDANYAAAVSQAVTLLVEVAPANVTANPSTLTLAAPGNSADTVLTVSGFNANNLQFTCSSLPYDAACSFSTLSGTGASGLATLRITTKASQSAALLRPGHDGDSGIGYALAFPGLLSLAGALFGWKRPMNRWSLLGLALLVSVGAVGSVLSGCGVTLNGTPTGTHAITVTAIAGSQSAATTIQLIIR